MKDGDLVNNNGNDCENCICHSGMVLCSSICQLNKDSCLSKSNDFEKYTWIDPQSGECCGKCIQEPGK